MISFKGAHFPQEVILVCVRWYVAYPLSYRNIEEMMAERGVVVDHSTLNRWVIRFAPLLEQEFRARKRLIGSSWRMDETYIKVKGEWKYLYRAVDKEGNTVDFLLTARRDRKAALRFFNKAISSMSHPGVPGMASCIKPMVDQLVKAATMSTSPCAKLIKLMMP